MKLIFSDRHPLSSDAFGAAIFEEDLYVPVEFKEICRKNHLKTAEDLLSLMHSFPTTICHALSWEMERFQRAKNGLIAILEGKVREPFLRPPPSPQRFMMGAKPPPNHPVQIGYMVPDEDLDE